MTRLYNYTNYTMVNLLNADKNSVSIPPGHQASPHNFRKALIYQPDLKRSELNAGLALLIRQVQEEHPPTVATVRNLNIRRDKNRFLRCYGRFDNSAVDEEAIKPIYLPGGSRATHLIIRDIHMKLKHAGHLTVLAELRHDFWTPNGRKTVKKALIDTHQHDAQHAIALI